jgi:hypothetical protein
MKADEIFVLLLVAVCVAVLLAARWKSKGTSRQE